MCLLQVNGLLESCLLFVSLPNEVIGLLSAIVVVTSYGYTLLVVLMVI